VLEWVWSTLFPARCVGCGRRGAVVCAACVLTVPYLSPRSCPRCALPRAARGPCCGCPRLSASLASVRAVCVYDGLARNAIHTLKFRSGRHVAPVLGGLLRANLQRRPLHVDLVVPAPIASARLRERGYNQAELLAQQVVDLVGGTLMADLLQKDDRPPQRTLSAAERQRNLRDAIRCAHPQMVGGRRVLLVDDVMTTGATLSACADALQAAGAERVFALVFARDV
jgi:competence protein ComFC